MKILLIEDEPMVRESIAVFLEDSGFTVVQAADGRDGITAFDREAFDLVLTDLRMPHVDGIDVLKHVTQSSPGTPIIIVSGTGVMQDAVNALRIGAWDFVLKPIQDMQILEHSINRSLERARLIRESILHREQLENKVAARTAELRAALAEKEQALTERMKMDQFITDILESVGEGLIVLDRDLRVISANRAFCEQTNMSLKDILHRHCFEISHHTSQPCYQNGKECPVMRTFETGLPHMAQHDHIDKSGNVISAEVKSYPMKDSEGKITTVIETIYDITEKKKLESQLQHAQKMEAVGHLAGGIAHDFNNILTAILGYGTLLKSKLLPDDQIHQYLDQILSSGERAAELTKSLLTFSRKQVITPKPVNLNDIIRNVEKILMRVIGEDIELKTILSEKDLIVFADSGQIDQVLMNLATNARDAMRRGGRLLIETGLFNADELYAKVHLFDNPGVYAYFSVSDTGEGINEEIQKKIFEPFFTTKEMGKGTGLGLSIVYGIIKQHNGSINVYSEQGKGTTFKIYLPVIEQAVQEIDQGAKTVLTGGNETILIAEDEEGLRVFLKSILDHVGYKVIEAASGEEAVSAYRKHRDKIRLLILDVIMPKMNGKEALKQIQAISANVRAIFMSGYPSDIITQFGALDEDIDYIVKPFNAHDLLKKVREVIDR